MNLVYQEGKETVHAQVCGMRGELLAILCTSVVPLHQGYRIETVEGMGARMWVELTA